MNAGLKVDGLMEGEHTSSAQMFILASLDQTPVCDLNPIQYLACNPVHLDVYARSKEDVGG